MRFNYNLPRPKKLVQDVQRINNSYFQAKDVQVTPLTKIGDAQKLHEEQSIGRLPTLTQKLRPHQLSLKALRKRRQVTVQDDSEPKKVPVRIFPTFQQPQAPAAIMALTTNKWHSHRLVRPIVLGAAILAIGLGAGSFQFVTASQSQQAQGKEAPQSTSGIAQNKPRAALLSSTQQQPTVPATATITSSERKVSAAKPAVNSTPTPTTIPAPTPSSPNQDTSTGAITPVPQQPTSSTPTSTKPTATTPNNQPVPTVDIPLTHINNPIPDTPDTDSDADDSANTVNEDGQAETNQSQTSQPDESDNQEDRQTTTTR